MVLLLLVGCGLRATTPAADAPAHDAAVGCTSGAEADSAAPALADTAPGARADSAAPALAPLSAELVVHAVRHAEKADEAEDPGLTEAGLARAEALAVLMEDVPLAAIYATDLRRTQETVAPTAARHGLPVVTGIDADEDLAAHLLAVHPGDTVLHAGHTDTLPDLFAALGVADAPSVSGYGQLWTVRVATDGCATVTVGRYGD